MNPMDRIERQFAQVFPVKARFQKTYCSQCGREFGPGNEGFSHCEDHSTDRLQELQSDLHIKGEQV